MYIDITYIGKLLMIKNQMNSQKLTKHASCTGTIHTKHCHDWCTLLFTVIICMVKKNSLQDN